MKIRLLSSVLAFTGIVLLVGCQRAHTPAQFDEAAIKTMTNNYNIAVQSAVHGHSYPAQFNNLFPNAVNGISYYTGEIGRPKWYSKAGLYGRYVLRMYCEIELDEARTNIVSMGSPDFDMCELTNITLNPSGSAKMQPHATAKFSLNTWQHLIDAKGDFHALGIELETNKAVEHFEEVWRKF
jgi:hypothetical protein